jgi:hypothetical protein
MNALLNSTLLERRLFVRCGLFRTDIRTIATPATCWLEQARPGIASPDIHPVPPLEPIENIGGFIASTAASSFLLQKVV